jgi:broad-specificity NMP kinase
MIVTIEGAPGEGKTALARRIAELLLTEGHVRHRSVRWESAPPPISDGQNPVVVAPDEVVIVDELPRHPIRGYEHQVAAGGVLVLIRSR